MATLIMQLICNSTVQCCPQINMVSVWLPLLSSDYGRKSRTRLAYIRRYYDKCLNEQLHLATARLGIYM
jgi:hypothetical protein